MVNKILRGIKLEWLEMPKQFSVDLIPRKSICPSCYKKVYTFEENPDVETNDNKNFLADLEKVTVIEINSVCSKLEISSATKIMKLNNSQRVPPLQKKSKKISDAAKRKLEGSFNEKLTDVPLPCISECTGCELEKLIQKLKDKFALSSKEDNDKIISLLSESWSNKKICDEFKVTDYLVWLTREMVKSEGILPDLTKKAGNPLNELVVNAMIEFYQEDENRKICPGKKDSVSIGKTVYKQKRLILLTRNKLIVQLK